MNIQRGQLLGIELLHHRHHRLVALEVSLIQGGV